MVLCICFMKTYYLNNGFALYHGDSISIMSKFPENHFDMVFADPPYNLSNGGFTVHAGKRVNVNKGKWDESKGFEEDFNFHQKWIKEVKRILKPHGTV